MKTFGTYMELIPGGYIRVLQPCDFRIMKDLKAGTRHRYTNWASNKMPDVLLSSVLLPPDKDTISGWCLPFFCFVYDDCVRATFQHMSLISDGSSATSAPYQFTPFPYVNQFSYGDDGFEEKSFDFRLEG